MLGIDVNELASVITCSVTVTKGERIQRNYSQNQAIGELLEYYLIQHITPSDMKGCVCQFVKFWRFGRNTCTSVASTKIIFVTN